MAGSDLLGGGGDALHRLLVELFPLNRSLTGPGVRETLSRLARHVPLAVHEVPTGTDAFDWTVPREWVLRDAYIADEHGHRIIDARAHNLHVVGYSIPVDGWFTLDELQPHLHSLPAQADAIPYVTSYYRENWGFCLTQRQRDAMAPGRYRVRIDAELKVGSLTYGELVIPGATDDEVLLSTYICHPSLANNELSGPVVATALAAWLATASRRYTYRIIYVPETIGALVYLSRHLAHLRRHVVAGYVVTCIGDDRAYSFVPSRAGDTLADRAARLVLGERDPSYRRYTYRDRGSDERQYCSPGVDLPVASVMRSKYREYPEYHTSLDDPSLVTPAGLQGGFTVLRDCLALIERNRTYRATCLGEPQLGRHGLWPAAAQDARELLDVLAYADGDHDLIALAQATGLPTTRLYGVVDRLAAAGLLAEVGGGHG